MKNIRIAGVLALACTMAVGCGSTHHPAAAATAGAPAMTVSPSTALYDTPVAVSVNDLPAGGQVTVTAQATDAAGVIWTSSARFSAPASGNISTAAPSDGGSYRGSNAMGLFEFMSPPPGDTRSTNFTSPARGHSVRLTASVGGRVVASGITQRETGVGAIPAPVALRPSGGGLYGEMHPAAGTGRHPAVLLFGGSEGGLINEPQATLLAAHGYPTLDLAYFKEPGLPSSLANIPLEYFARALTYLRAQPGVDPHHVTIKGGSRGGEAALLIGATYPALVNAVVAGSPSSQVNIGYPDGTKPAWTLHGAPVAPADIAVERIRGPILLACGGRDSVWNSCLSVTDITDRLKSHHFGYPVTALRYPEAGHVVASMSGYSSVTAAGLLRFGGTLTANQTAEADAHASLLAFLAAQD